jgi:hypothetical protein
MGYNISNFRGSTLNYNVITGEGHEYCYSCCIGICPNTVSLNSTSTEFVKLMITDSTLIF